MAALACLAVFTHSVYSGAVVLAGRYTLNEIKINFVYKYSTGFWLRLFSLLNILNFFAIQYLRWFAGS